MARNELAVDSVGEAYLALLAARGVDYLFANAGTDFAPLVEAFAKAARTGTPIPKPVLATHENLALSMAHGYAMVTGRVPAVMVHVSVGTANGVCAAFNAARENVPMLFTAGRSPLTEEGMAGTRDVYIHWAQEMFDQAGMVREIVKWDYELRNGQQLETVVDRALAIATSAPKGRSICHCRARCWRRRFRDSLTTCRAAGPARRRPDLTRPRSTRRRESSRRRSIR